MIKYLLSLVLLLVSGSALADYPAVLQSAMFNNSGGSYASYPTGLEACQKSTSSPYPPPSNASYSDLRFTLTGPANLASSYQCEIVWKTGAPTLQSKQINFYCPYQPASLNGGTCVGASSGPPPPCADTTTVFKISQSFGSAGAPGFLPPQIGGCNIVIVELLHCWKKIVSKEEYCEFMVRRTGVQSTGADAPGGVVAPSGPGPTDVNSTLPQTTLPPGVSTCPKGTVQGGFDSSGIPICIGTGTLSNNPAVTAPTSVAKPPVTVTNADGSTTVTKETSYTNKDGSTTVVKDVTTTATDGTVSKGGTVTTGANAAGGGGTMDKGEDDKSDLCAKNPTLSICRNSSVSGTCGQITCSGDAIQCATLRSIAVMECREKKNEDDTAALPSTALGSSILGGNDPMKDQIDSAIAGTSVNMSSSLDQTGFLARSCFGNKSFTVAGKTITVEFASLCSGIEPLKYLILSVAMLVAYLIVAKSVLGS